MSMPAYDPLRPGALATALEANQWVRARLRDQGQSHITRWPNLKTVGIPSVAAMSCNAAVLQMLAEWWCPSQSGPKAIPVDVLRREARQYCKRYTVELFIWGQDECVSVYP